MLNNEKIRFGSAEYKKLNLEERLEILEEAVKVILDSKKRADAQPDQNEQDITPLLDKVETKDAIIICFRKMGSQTKERLQENLRKWGIPFGSWFTGGNFKNRLLDEGILVHEGKDENGKTIYTLSIRGRKLAHELISKIEASKGI